MLYLVIKNFDTKEVIGEVFYNPKRGERHELSEKSLRSIERLQETQDILGLGRTCKIKHSGFGLGNYQFFYKGNKSQTVNFEDSVHKTSKVPDMLIILEEDGSETDTGLRVIVEAYCYGLILNAGSKNYYFKKFSSSKCYFGFIHEAKVFNRPKDMLKYMEKNKDKFSYLVQNNGCKYSVEYATSEYESYEKEQPDYGKWQEEEKELNSFLDELNSSEKGEDDYMTEQARIHAEWENSGCEGEEPPLTMEDIRLEATKRMRMLNMFKGAIDLFALSPDKELPMNIPGNASVGMPFYGDLDEEAERVVKEVKAMGLFPYAVIRTYHEFMGTVTDVLYVSRDASGWLNDRPDKDGYVTSACSSDATFGGFDFGEIRLKTYPITGALARIE